MKEGWRRALYTEQNGQLETDSLETGSRVAHTGPLLQAEFADMFKFTCVSELAGGIIPVLDLVISLLT